MLYRGADGIPITSCDWLVFNSCNWCILLLAVPLVVCFLPASQAVISDHGIHASLISIPLSVLMLLGRSNQKLGILMDTLCVPVLIPKPWI